MIEKIQSLDGKIEKSEQIFKCCDCEESFKSKGVLKSHRNEKHKSGLFCSECGEAFEKHWMLELHLKSHENIDSYDCEVCKKKFHVKWRLRKHMEIHNNAQTKKCHFFNNKKICPYEEIGCKFLHKVSEMCFHKENCKNKLCPFRHEGTDAEDIVEKEIYICANPVDNIQ